MLNISNRTVSKWENGDGFPDISLIPEIASIFGISTDELFSGELNTTEEEKAYPTFTFLGKDSLKTHLAIQKKYYRGRVPLWFQIIITICIVLIMVFSSCFVSATSNDKIFNYTILIIALFVILMLSFCTPYVNGVFSYINSRAFNGNKSVDSKLEISDRIYLDNSTRHWVYNFSDVTGFYDYKDYYIIKIHKRVMIASKKSELQTGDNAEFEEYFKSKITQKNESRFRFVLNIVLSVMLITEAIIMGLLLLYTVDFNSIEKPYTIEEIVELDDESICDKVYDKVYDKTDYNEETENLVLTPLNQIELNFYYVYNFYYELYYGENDIVGYICGNNEDLPYLSGALYSLGLNDIAAELDKFIKSNNIDLANISKENYIEYEKAYEIYDQTEFEAYANKNDISKKLIKALADYVKEHQSDFE